MYMMFFCLINTDFKFSALLTKVTNSAGQNLRQLWLRNLMIQTVKLTFFLMLVIEHSQNLSESNETIFLKTVTFICQLLTIKHKTAKSYFCICGVYALFFSEFSLVQILVSLR
jgi:hypothetical protein